MENLENYNSMTHVLVTGADGFIGKALCRRMLDEGWNVRGAIRSVEKKESLPNGVDAIEIGSIGPDTRWETALKDIEAVVHLAAQLNFKKHDSVETISLYRKTNVIGTIHLAKVAESMGVRRFIFLSSIKVIGEEKAGPYTEKDKPIPIGPYGMFKLEAEEFLEEFNSCTSLEVVVLRPPLVYGPGVKGNFLKILKLVDKGVPLPFERVENHRSLIFIDNLIDAIITCLKHPDAAGEKYFVSDAEIVSTPEFIRRIAASLGRPARLFSLPPKLLHRVAKFAGMSETAMRLLDSLVVDTSKIRNELGWIPPYTQQEGLSLTAQWFLTEQSQSNKK
jgi:nucleoside-diphosphate-sugar epimerase